MSLRIDSEQRFTCSQCGRCCRGFDVVVTAAEIELYRKRNAAAWFRDDEDGAGREPFEPVPGAPTVHRLRKRADGACGFLTGDNRCRIHQELGAAKKPLTCRLFPYAFHPAADGVVVTASFNCPTIVANEGRPIAESRAELESLRKEWFVIHPATPVSLELITGRSMNTRSLLVLRQSLIAMLTRDSSDVRAGVRRIAAAIDDLTRSRVLALPEQDFGEYLSLTVPHAASAAEAPAPRVPGSIARLLQYGFLYTVAAIRADIGHPGQSKSRLRLRRLQLLAHFHGLAPALDRVNVRGLKRRRIDINQPDIRAIVFHYLRSTIETLGAGHRPIVDELAMAASYLNAACALARMNADALGRDVDRQIFIDAITEASDASHARHALLDWILRRFSGTTEALWELAREV